MGIPSNAVSFFEVTSLPDDDTGMLSLFDSIGGNTFYLIYDFGRNSTILGVENARAEFAKEASFNVPGFELQKCNYGFSTGNWSVKNFYRKTSTIDKTKVFDDIFDLQENEGALAIVFVPIGLDEIRTAKAFVETTLSKQKTGETISVPSDLLSRKVNSSLHHESFQNSEEVMMLSEILESINASVLKNGLAYKTYLLTNLDKKTVNDYINSRLLVLSECRIKSAGMPSTAELSRIKAIPVGVDIASAFLNFRGAYSLNHLIHTIKPRQVPGIKVGTYMKEGVIDTNWDVRLEPSALNLGCMITGLPGSGKTKEAMIMIESLMTAESKPSIAIISPTNEWNDFAVKNGMYLVRIYDDSTPINFFRCSEAVNPIQFYEDLAMILSSASNAGPYRNPMEKCMLSAFRRVYSETRTPDPVSVYEEIERSLVRFHARKTGSGYKYTKHGENIHSALENLRAIISRVEYSCTNGIRFEELMKNGIIFDLSRVSNAAKPYFYALILNQLYSIATTFDTNNDSRLKLLMCLEEAQLVFRDPEAASVQDLKYRIQDFRKQGIGLMLLTHNIVDIEPSIRRLCQIKLYLKQAPDIAEMAAKDLIFTHIEEDSVVSKLKHLNSRVGALNYVVKQGGDKLVHDTVFIRTVDYDEVAAINPKDLLSGYVKEARIKPMEYIDCELKFETTVNSEAERELVKKATGIRIGFLGEYVYEGRLERKVVVRHLLSGKRYALEVLNSKGRVCFEGYFLAKQNATVKINF